MIEETWLIRRLFDGPRRPSKWNRICNRFRWFFKHVIKKIIINGMMNLNDGIMGKGRRTRLGQKRIIKQSRNRRSTR